MKKILLLALYFFSLKAFSQDIKTNPQSFPEHVSYLESRKSDTLQLDKAWKITYPKGYEEESIHVPFAFPQDMQVRLEKWITLPTSTQFLKKELVFDGMWPDFHIYLNGVFIAGSKPGRSGYRVPIPNDAISYDKQNKLEIEFQGKSTSQAYASNKIFSARRPNGVFGTIYLRTIPSISISNISVIAHQKNNKLSNYYNPIQVELSVIKNRETSRKSSLENETTRLFTHLDVYSDTILESSHQSIASFLLIDSNTQRIDTSIIIKKGIKILPSQNSKSKKTFIFTLSTEKGAIIDQASVSTNLTHNVKQSEKSLRRGIKLILDESFILRHTLHSDIEQTLSRILSMGLNTILFDCQPSDRWLESCDKLGIQVFISLPIGYHPSRILSNKDHIEETVATIKNLIESAKFHSCVKGFYVGEAINVSNPLAESFLESVYQAVKADTNKLVIYSPQNLVNSSLYQYCDIIGVRKFIHKGTSFKDFVEKATFIAKNSGKPMIVFGLGSNVEPNNKNGYADTRSEEYQAKNLFDNLSFLEEYQDVHLSGYLIENYNDFKTTSDNLTYHIYGDSKLSTYGLVDIKGNHRQSFQTVETTLNKKKPLALAEGKAPKEQKFIFTVIAFVTLASVLTLFNTRPRSRQFLSHSLFRPFLLYMDIKENRLSFGLESFLLILILSLGHGTLIATILDQEKSSFFLAVASSYLVPDIISLEIISMITSPVLSILVFWMISFVIWFLLILYLKTCSFLASPSYNRVNFSQFLSLGAWSSSHWIIFILIPIIVERVQHPLELHIIGWLALLFLLLSIFRLLRGVFLVDESRKLKHYVFLSVIAVTFFVAWFLSSDSFASLLNHTKYWNNF